MPDRSSEPRAVVPIGTYHGSATHRFSAPPQPGLTEGRRGHIELRAGNNFEVALADLSGFSHIWVLFWFHEVQGWKPKVQPPRRSNRCGVFATRSPHRPNPIGLSCVRLAEVSGRVLHVTDADLIDGTPVLDIKPYLPYADSHPEATLGWVPEDFPRFTLAWSETAQRQKSWLTAHGVPIDDWVHAPLTLFPFPRRGHRIQDRETVDGVTSARLSCRTWRLDFLRSSDRRSVTVTRIRSGHSPDVLAGAPSEWADVAVHQQYVRKWPGTRSE